MVPNSKPGGYSSAWGAKVGERALHAQGRMRRDVPARTKCKPWVNICACPASSPELGSPLFETASLTGGSYFTTAQADEVGYSPQLLAKYLQNGRVIRARRGIYRLVHFPPGEHEELTTVWLWSDRAGIFSHETALSLHVLSDVMPARIHPTLPAKWVKRRCRVWEGVVLHHGRRRRPRARLGGQRCRSNLAPPNAGRRTAREPLPRSSSSKRPGKPERAGSHRQERRRTPRIRRDVVTARPLPTPRRLQASLGDEAEDARRRRDSTSVAAGSCSSSNAFLARTVVVFGDAATLLKGGLALELRLERARTTSNT